MKDTIQKIVVVGSSGHAKIVLDIIKKEERYRVVGLLDSYRELGAELYGCRIIGRCEEIALLRTRQQIDGVIVAIGDNWVRGRMVDKIQGLAPELVFVSAVHPSAVIGIDACVGRGSVIAARAVVNPGARVGDFCIVNTCASLDHDGVMMDYSSLGPGAVAGGEVRIGRHSVIAIGATLIHDVMIGEQTVIGAGATVVSDIPDHVVAYGTPARVVRAREAGDGYLGNKQERAKARQNTSRFRAETGKVRLLRPDDPKWSELLERAPHDFFHSAAYHRFSETLGEGEAWMATYETSGKLFAWPYMLREIQPADGSNYTQCKDITSTYGYSGPVVAGCEPGDPFIGSAWAAINEIWLKQDAVSVFTRFHPLLANDRSMAPVAPDGLSRVGRTVCVDIGLPKDEIVAGYKRQLRQALRRNERLGMMTEIDPEWKFLADFMRAYHQTMKRNRAAPFYFFSEDYFLQLKRALGPHGFLVVTKINGIAAAAAVVIEYRGLATLHLAATADEYYSLSPCKTVFHECGMWAHSRGNHSLHLGGGRGASDRDSLFLFKKLLSPESEGRQFVVGRWTLNADSYKQLTEKHQNVAAGLASQVDSAYFPAYRAPFTAATQDAELDSPQFENCASALAD